MKKLILIILVTSFAICSKSWAEEYPLNKYLICNLDKDIFFYKNKKYKYNTKFFIGIHFQTGSKLIFKFFKIKSSSTMFFNETNNNNTKKSKKLEKTTWEIAESKFNYEANSDFITWEEKHILGPGSSKFILDRKTLNLNDKKCELVSKDIFDFNFKTRLEAINNEHSNFIWRYNKFIEDENKYDPAGNKI